MPSMYRKVSPQHDGRRNRPFRRAHTRYAAAMKVGESRRFPIALYKTMSVIVGKACWAQGRKYVVSKSPSQRTFVLTREA